MVTYAVSVMFLCFCSGYYVFMFGEIQWLFKH